MRKWEMKYCHGCKHFSDECRRGSCFIKLREDKEDEAKRYKLKE